MLGKEKMLIEKYEGQISAIIGPFTLSNETHKVDWADKVSTGIYCLKTSDGKTISTFRLEPMINCCGILISTAVEVTPSYRGRGLGTILNNLRIDIARFLGYGVLLCTDIANNEYQRKILNKNGWKDIFKFVNPRTKNVIFISVINL